MLNKETQTEQKLRGGYYTPYPIAQYLWKWVYKKGYSSLLEPAAGDGALLRPIKDKSVKIDAIEIFKSEANKIKNTRTISQQTNVYNTDFLAWYEEHSSNRYDMLLSNPPYIRYQYLSPQQRDIQSQILKKNELQPNKLINSWVPFVIAGISMVKDGGRIGLVIPTDFLQVTYAKQLREFISKQLQSLVIITFSENLFPGTQQDFLLLLGEKGKGSLKFKHARIDDLNNLPAISTLSLEKPPSASSAKWTDLNLTYNERSYLQSIKANLISFNTVAKTQVGITTGANSFFSLTDSDVQRLHAKEFVKPLLGRSVSINSCFFSNHTLSLNSKLNQKIWLLDLNGYTLNQLPKELQNYIEDAENNEVSNAYKLRIRKVWYQIPNIWEPDAFLLRRIGNVPKLVINEADGVSTDTFHRVNFADNINRSTVLISFYSSISLASLELAGRSYGGGALEILPGDLESFYIPRIDYSSQINLDHELQKLDKLIRTNDIQQISRYADSVLINNFDFDFDYTQSQKILSHLQSIRTNKKS